MNYRVIDAHVHLGLGEMNQDCTEYVKRAGLRYKPMPAEVNLELEDVVVEKVVLVPSFPCGNTASTDGFWPQKHWRSMMEDRFLQYGTVNPNSEVSVEEELASQYSGGIVGIKLHPVHHFYKPNDYREEEKGLGRLQQVYEFAEDHHLPVIIHTGTSITKGARSKYGDPIYIEDVARDFRINVIMAHGGRPLWTSTAMFLAKQFSNVFLEISSVPAKRVKEYFPRIGEIKDKVIYGSDFPNFPGESIPGDAAMMIRTLGYDAGIFHDNFLRVAANVP